VLIRYNSCNAITAVVISLLLACYLINLNSSDISYNYHAARLRPMRFTDEPAPGYTAFPIGTLQVFTVKVAGIKRGLQWPLDVFGFVAVSDSIDNVRTAQFNVILSKTVGCYREDES
jgi:hypothetical protein